MATNKKQAQPKGTRTVAAAAAPAATTTTTTSTVAAHLLVLVQAIVAACTTPVWWYMAQGRNPAPGKHTPAGSGWLRALVLHGQPTPTTSGAAGTVYQGAALAWACWAPNAAPNAAPLHQQGYGCKPGAARWLVVAGASPVAGVAAGGPTGRQCVAVQGGTATLYMGGHGSNGNPVLHLPGSTTTKHGGKGGYYQVPLVLAAHNWATLAAGLPVPAPTK